MKRKVFSALVAAMVVLSLTAASGCGSQSTDAGADSGEKILKVGQTWMAPLDAQVDYNGWYTTAYGITETLFRIDNDYKVVPWLAQGYESEGNTWTITLKEGLTFSNGDAVNAQAVVDSLLRSGEMNVRAAVFTTADMKVLDERTFSITTQEVYPTLVNDLTEPYTAILDLDAAEDFNTKPIGTGPMEVVSYTADNEVDVRKNENYWGGTVTLDGAVFYCIPDEDTLGMSLQNGEIDAYVGPTGDYMEVFAGDKDLDMVSVPQTRQQMFYCNRDRINDDAVTTAVMMSMDRDALVSVMGGTVSSTQGPFDSDTGYGDVSAVPFDVEQARVLLEEDGYVAGEDGYYQKDGSTLELKVAYYAARSLDKVSVLVQDQLKQAGIKATLVAYENPDSTYLATGDYDIGMYSAVADLTGDPYPFLSNYMGSTGSANYAGYANPDVDALLEKLAGEVDTDTRAKLANEIQQQVIDDKAYCFLTVFNKVTAMKKGVSGVSEENPLTIYFVNAQTDIQ